MSRSIRLRPKARADLQGIWRYTSDQWGAEQASAYNGEIEAALLKVAENPSLGATRDYLHQGLRKAAVRSHCIYFLFDEETVDVVRILHNRMDIEAVL